MGYSSRARAIRRGKFFEWDTQDPLTPSLVRECGKHSRRVKVEKLDYLDFTKGLVESKEWHGEVEQAIVVKYARLIALFEDYLTEPAVFRVGNVNVTYYIVGKPEAGNWVGVKAKAVET